jgi:hypothetical protein
MAETHSTDTLNEDDWNDLLDNIKDRLCTPFIGAGACFGILPLARDIASQWAADHKYPFEDDKTDLARVAQFLALKKSEIFPKREIQKQFSIKNVKPPEFSEPDEPHGVLADLNLPIYITTNYDNFMLLALKNRDKNDAKEEFCRWNNFTLNDNLVPKPVFESGYKPTPSSPLVYHLHGYMEVPQSMVLTESDYLDFLIGLSRNDIKLPSSINMALAGTSLLFVGYSLADWNFRVLFRGLINLAKANASYSSIAVQLPPNISKQNKEDKEVKEAAFAYLDKYLEKIHGVKLRVYWGNAREFSKELRKRWKV